MGENITSKMNLPFRFKIFNEDNINIHNKNVILIRNGTRISPNAYTIQNNNLIFKRSYLKNFAESYYYELTKTFNQSSRSEIDSYEVIENNHKVVREIEDLILSSSFYLIVFVNQENDKDINLIESISYIKNYPYSNAISFPYLDPVDLILVDGVNLPHQSINKGILQYLRPANIDNSQLRNIINHSDITHLSIHELSNNLIETL